VSTNLGSGAGITAGQAVAKRSSADRGGDTADAFLGERPVRVVASLAAGLALGEVLIDGRTVPILTKPGGFGQDQLLVELLRARGQR